MIREWIDYRLDLVVGVAKPRWPSRQQFGKIAGVDGRHPVEAELSVLHGGSPVAKEGRMPGLPHLVHPADLRDTDILSWFL